MSGSRLGRGRGGRLAVYGGCGVVVILLVFLYRAATSEMARLRELHVQCAHQQEALAAQLQVIFEYKVRLEKSLAEEKSSNAAVKQEWQQRASREKSLRDKDSVEATQRYNSLEQSYKILKTEHQDLQEEYKKREKQALEETNRLEGTLRELRGTIKRAQEDKDKSLEHLKNRYMQLENEKEKLEEKYQQLLKNKDSTEGKIDHLKKEVIQLRRELEESKRSHKTSSPGPSLASPQPLQQSARPSSFNTDGSAGAPSSIKEPPQHQQQQSSATPSSINTVPALRVESSTKSGASVGSTSIGKAVRQTRTGLKLKIPLGVVAIPPMNYQQENQENQEDKRNDDLRRKDEFGQNPPPKNNLDPGSREKIQQADGNIDSPVRHIGEQIIERRDKSWSRHRLPFQEVGEEPNNLDNLHGFEDGIERQAGDDDQYGDVEYEKEPQQKINDIHMVVGEDEGEDEDDYPHNLNQEKHE